MPFDPSTAVLDESPEMRFDSSTAVLETPSQGASKDEWDEYYRLTVTPQKTFARDLGVAALHFGNQYAGNVPRAVATGVGRPINFEAETRAGKIIAPIAGVAGAVMGLPNLVVAGALKIGSRIIPKAIVPLEKIAGAKFGQKIATGAASGAVGGLTYAPEVENGKPADYLKQYAQQTALGSVLGSAFPFAAKQVGKVITRLGATPEEIAKANIERNAKIYREIIRPEKGEIKNLEIKSKKSADEIFKLAAFEGLPFRRTPDKKLDTAIARAQVVRRVGELEEKLTEALASDRRKQFSLAKIGYRATQELRKYFKNDTEYKSAIDDVFQYIGDAIDARGNNLTGSQLNDFKRGMWSVAFNDTRPTSDKAARIIGNIAKEEIEGVYKNFAVKAINKKMGDYLTLNKMLENAHGRVVPGGRIGGYSAQGIGAMVGGAVGNAVAPGWGMAIGMPVGREIGKVAHEFINDPARITSRIIPQTVKPSPVAPIIRSAMEEGERYIKRKGEEGEKMIQSAGRLRGLSIEDVSSPVSPLGFYSKAEEVINTKIPNAVHKDQLIATLKANGVKDEEISQLGLDTLEGKVSKSDIQTLVKANQVPLEERVLGEGLKLSEPQQQPNGRWFIYDQNGKIFGDYASKETALGGIKLNTGYQESPSKFSQYQLPGGENYREVLIKLPVETKTKQLNGREMKMADLDKTFRSSHFDDPNILVHARINDRMVDGKKVLFIEEIQSDWHQAGRKKGYGTKQVPFKGSDVKQGEDGKWGFWQDGHWTSTRFFDTEAEAVAHQANMRVRVPPPATITEGVPDAPFKKTWHELMFKRLLDKAVKEGYDAVAWTTGEQQAERYKLSKQVDNIDWAKNDRGKGLFIATKDGNHVRIGINNEGIVSDAPPITGSNILGKHLSDVVGKPVAEKILASDKGSLEGEGLDLGSSGMKGFYDQMLPSFVNKYTKKWGGKVGEANIGNKITISHDSIDRLYFVRDINGRELGSFKTIGEARDFVGELKQTSMKGMVGETKVHSLDITPAMRGEIKQRGQPLFQALGATALGLGMYRKNNKEK